MFDLYNFINSYFYHPLGSDYIMRNLDWKGVPFVYIVSSQY